MIDTDTHELARLLAPADIGKRPPHDEVAGHKPASPLTRSDGGKDEDSPVTINKSKDLEITKDLGVSPSPLHTRQIH